MIQLKRILVLPAILATLAVSACGPGELQVIAEIETRDPDTGEMSVQPLPDLEIRVHPFDRDAVFDSLAQAHDTPEPQIPDELLTMQDSILVVQSRARDAEMRELQLREELREISAETEQYSPAEARYSQLVREFDEKDFQFQEAQDERQEQYALYESLQREVLDDLSTASIQVEQWEDAAFSDYGEVVDRKLSETRREILEEETDATGMVRFRPQTGVWWVHARHQTVTEELYWNIRVDIDRGDPVVIRLTRDNAESRRVF